MILKHLETGPLMVNTFIIGDENTSQAMVVDPGGSVGNILSLLKKESLKCEMIFNTHTHWDHVGGNGELKQATGAKIITHEKEAPMLAVASNQARMFGMNTPNSPNADETVQEGDVLKIGSIELKVIELPGHSPCGVGLVFDKYVIVGDSLFAGSIGRTDFLGGDMGLLLSNIREKVFTLPEDVIVLPGHGPATTVGREKNTNPFF